MNTFLGRPLASIEAWIKEHRPPPPPLVKEETMFWIDEVEQESVLIEGELDYQWFIKHGYFNGSIWLKQITKVKLGFKVTSIGNYAFNSCYSLTSITLPSSVTSIGKYAFFYCYSLTSITLPSSVTSIDDNAFYCCDNLSTVYVDSESEKARVKGLYAWPETVQFEVKA